MGAILDRAVDAYCWRRAAVASTSAVALTSSIKFKYTDCLDVSCLCLMPSRMFPFVSRDKDVVATALCDMLFA